jgi:hypothetical protein
MRLQVFFALIRDGINHIWRHEGVTADEDSYHVLPFHLTALALGTDISMDSLDHLASILGIDEFPQSAWSFTLTCTAIEKALAAKGFTKNSVTYADGATGLQKLARHLVALVGRERARHYEKNHAVGARHCACICLGGAFESGLGLSDYARFNFSRSLR